MPQRFISSIILRQRDLIRVRVSIMIMTSFYAIKVSKHEQISVKKTNRLSFNVSVCYD